MRTVSKRLAKLSAVTGVVFLLGSQPAIAQSRDSSAGDVGRTVWRTIVRILDLTQIRFPPG
jgi:hypothetical protein